MHQSVIDRLVMMLFILVNVAWDKGMNEARLWYVGFWNMGCKISIKYVVSFGLDSWTCKRTADNVLVQLGYIIGMPAFVMMSTWNDYELPIGLDHRCVHCILTLLDTTQGVQHRRPGLKHWMPNLNCHGEPQVFEGKLRAFFNGLPFTCSSFEAGLLKAGEQGGTCTTRCVAFKSSQALIEKKTSEKINYRSCLLKSSACIGKSCGLGSPNKSPNMYTILACGKGYVHHRIQMILPTCWKHCLLVVHSHLNGQ